jgi:hypothetical protein
MRFIVLLVLAVWSCWHAYASFIGEPGGETTATQRPCEAETALWICRLQRGFQWTLQ